MAAVARAVANGHITPSEAGEIAKVIDAYVRTYQAAELDERLACAEQLRFFFFCKNGIALAATRSDQR